MRVKGSIWGPCKPPLFKGAHPSALAVISDWFAYKLQGHSSTIGVGASWKGGALRVRVAGRFALQSDTGGIYLFHSPHYIFTWPCLP